MGKLVKQVTAFESTDGGLHSNYASAARDSASDRIAELVVNSRGLEEDTDGDITEYGDSVRTLFPEGQTYAHAYAFGEFLQEHKAAFKAILRDL